MTIRVVDAASAAVAADAQLASPVLQWAADTALAAQTDCTRGAVAAWDFRYPPQLHSIPAGNDDQAAPAAEFGWYPLLWRPSARVTGLTVRVRCTTYVGPVRLGVHIQRLDDLLRAGISARLQTYDTSAGEETATMAVAGISLEPGALYAVCISAQSSLATEGIEGLYDGNHGAAGTALDGWISPGLYALNDVSRDNYWSEDGVTFAALAEDDRPYLLEIVSGSDPFTAAYDDAKVGAPVPRGRLLWRVGRAVSNLGQLDGADGSDVADVLWCWPPIEERLANSVIGSGDWIRRTPIAYVHLHSAEIVESVAPLEGYGTLLAPERRAPSAAGTAAAVYADHAVGRYARAYACAPSCDYPASQVESVLGGYVHHAGVRVPISGSWSVDGDGQLVYGMSYATLAETVVGDPSAWTVPGASIGYAHAAYRASGLIYIQASSWGGEDPLELDFTVKGTVTDLAGGDASTSVEVTVSAAPVVSYAQIHTDLVQRGHWQGFQGGSSTRDLQRHSMRGAWCNTAWRFARPAVFEIVVPDDVSPRNRDRLLLLEIKAGVAPTFGANRAYFLLDGLHVEAIPGFGDDAAVEVP